MKNTLGAYTGSGDFHLLSRLRTNITLYEHTPVMTAGEKRRRGRPRKYGDRLGSVDQCAGPYRELAQTLSVFLYGKQRDVLAYSRTVMLKTMKRKVRVVWIFRKSSYVLVATLPWIYADRLQYEPDRKYKIRGPPVLHSPM